MRGSIAILISILAMPAWATSNPDPRCSMFGEGFSYVDSIGSCVRIGGIVRADAGIGRGGGRRGGAAGLGSRAAVGMEVDKETELGPFRAVVIPRVREFDGLR